MALSVCTPIMAGNTVAIIPKLGRPRNEAPRHGERRTGSSFSWRSLFPLLTYQDPWERSAPRSGRSRFVSRYHRPRSAMSHHGRRQRRDGAENAEDQIHTLLPRRYTVFAGFIAPAN